MPGALRGMDEARIVDVDVRDDLRSGREPFARIMDARRTLPADGVLRLRAIFEPRPLFGVMAAQGLGHWSERLADDDWRIWFFADGGGEAAGTRTDGAARSRAAEREDGADDGVVVLDVRGLEPPEPMVRTLEALEALPCDATLVQLNERVPRFLFPNLQERGFAWEVREQEPELVRVFIRRAAPAEPERVLDVRPIPPREKHPAIFATFDALEPGTAFVLVNDHDPVPLKYQFEAERAGAFSWRYLEEGPTLWRVEIVRTGAGS